MQKPDPKSQFPDPFFMSEQLLNLTEVKQLLDLNDDEIMRMVREGKLNAFKIGGSFLRFDRTQVYSLKTRLDVARETKARRYTFWSRITDFLKFYGLYILSVAVILYVLYYFLVKG